MVWQFYFLSAYQILHNVYLMSYLINAERETLEQEHSVTVGINFTPRLIAYTGADFISKTLVTLVIFIWMQTHY